MSPRLTRAASRRFAALAVLCGAALAVPLTITNLAQADRRTFAYTYPHMTLPEGGRELEHYLDATFAKEDDPETADVIEARWRPSWKHQLEFEYGITDYLDFGFYNRFSQKAYQPLQYDGVKLRSRLRIGDQGEYFVDPAMYLEVFYYGDEYGLEERLILSKIVGDLELGLNLKVEQEVKLGDETEYEYIVAPSFGIAYHLRESVALGAEYQGRVAWEDGEASDYAQFAGPTASVQGDGFFWTLAFQPQLTRPTQTGRPNFQFRSLFGIHL